MKTTILEFPLLYQTKIYLVISFQDSSIIKVRKHGKNKKFTIVNQFEVCYHFVRDISFQLDFRLGHQLTMEKS